MYHRPWNYEIAVSRHEEMFLFGNVEFKRKLTDKRDWSILLSPRKSE